MQLYSRKKRRIELRTIDGSCNPYLAYSTKLMAGLDGTEKEIDPREEGYGPLEENVYEISEKELLKSAPVSLTSSLNFLEEDYDYLLRGGSVYLKSRKLKTG